VGGAVTRRQGSLSPAGAYSVPAWGEPVGELGAVEDRVWCRHNPYSEWYWNTMEHHYYGATAMSGDAAGPSEAPWARWARGRHLPGAKRGAALAAPLLAALRRC
jgi:hypothetical protein